MAAMATLRGLCMLLLTTGAWCGTIRLRSGSNSLELDPNTEMANMPENITMQVVMDTWVAHLQLVRSHVVDTNMPVLLGTDQEAFVLWNSPAELEDFAVYVDVDRRASIVVWTEINSATGKTTNGMMGTFDHQENTYSLEPMDTRMTRTSSYDYDDDFQPVMVKMYDTRLTMTRVNKSEYETMGSEPVTSPAASLLQQQVSAYMATNPAPSMVQTDVELELLVVADFAIFEKWVQKSRALDYRSREVEAIKNIRYYYAQLLSGVAQRYRGMTENGNTIHFRPVALYIAKSAKASYWTELSPIKQEYHYTEAHQAVITFEKWINQQEKTLPPFDLAMLVTGNHLFNGYTTGRLRKIISGLSNVMGICRQQRVLVSHDGGLYHGIQIATRELAHSLGVYQGDVNCKNQEKYTGTDVSRQENADELHEFSGCSKQAFWNFMEYMSQNHSNCLLDRHNYNTDWSAADNTMKYLGQRYTINEQCLMINGRDSFHCGGDHRDQTTCSRLYCWNYFSGVCQDIVNEFVADGTPCGNKQWCIEGECVKDPAAPMYHDAQCVHGDSTEVVDHVKGYKCYDMGINEPFRCYDNYFRRSCCETCGKLFNANDDAVGCEYGDKEPSLCHEDVRASDCYDPLVASACCETCSRFTVNQPGCEYGDKAADCQDAAKNPYMCYTRNTTCCWTCPRLQVGFLDCEWGNRETWCDLYPKSNCYEPGFASQCCETCNKKRDGPIGCEWGDRDSRCSEEDCEGDRKINCCEMCRTTTTSTTTVQTTDTSPTTSSVGPDSILVMDDICKDTSMYCHEIKGGFDCYHRHERCCGTCSQYETDDPACLFGDQISWCKDYIRREGSDRCNSDPYIRNMCCESCNLDKDEVPQSVSRWLKVCKDTASWCDIIKSGQCYDMGTRQTCCHTCTAMATKDPKCKFGDVYSWCEPKYCAKHSKECCNTCKKP